MKPQPPVPDSRVPSKSGYGHSPSTDGRVTPQGGGNAIGPDDGDAGTSSEKRQSPSAPARRRPGRSR